jgi:hypothetical protein
MKRLVLLALALGACGTDPVQLAGNYTVGVTNRDNGCNLANWTVGAMTSGVTVAITQNGSTATADLTGGVGALFDFAFGSSTFTGTVDGTMFTLDLQGTRPQTAGNCTYTYDGQIIGASNGDIITGRINYTAADNGHTDCTSMNIHGCVTYQDYNGSRPPP